MSRNRFFASILAAFLLVGPLSAAHPAAPVGRGGAVVSGEAAATEAGIEILRGGGNAVDAAVATALALAVVHPEAGNLAGGGFAILRLDGELASLDFRETAPAAAHREMFLDERGEPVPGASTVGPLATGVPGSFSGYHELHRRFGRLAWPRVVAPAERLAREGFALSLRTHRALQRRRESLARFPESASVWLPGGEPPVAGSRVRLPELAETLRHYAETGPSAMTEGPVAAAIEAASARHGGVLRAEDLAAYRPVWREPLRYSAFGWQMASMALPSSGGWIAATTLDLLARLGWSSRPRFGAERIHLLAESLRRAFADRFLMADPESMRIDPHSLLSEPRLARLAKTVDPDRASLSADVYPGAGRTPESAQTTHLSVVDGEGNLVALTTTLNGLFGCKLWVPEIGFLNNEMDDFTSAPGRPNIYGLVQGDSNAVHPGRRMLSSMAPTLAWNEEGETLALGSRGGSRIPSAILQVLLNAIVEGDPLQTAVNRPRVHHQWQPDRLETEADLLSPETRKALADRGHTLHLTGPNDRAKVNVVRWKADGTVEAAADPRGPAVAAVLQPYPLAVDADQR